MTTMICEPETTTTPTLADAVEHEARSYRARGTPLGDFLSRELGKLAQLIAWTHATTPEEHESRFEAWEMEVREQYEARGYEAGRQAGRDECGCHGEPLDRTPEGHGRPQRLPEGNPDNRKP